MDKQVMEIIWPSLRITVLAESLEYNQHLSRKFWESLPFNTVQLHAMVTGEDMYSYCPVSPVEHLHLVEKKIPINEVPPGHVTWSALGLVAIVYGECTEPLTTQPIAYIPEQFHQDLKRAGKAAWDSIYLTKQKLVVEFKRKGGG